MYCPNKYSTTLVSLYVSYLQVTFLLLSIYLYYLREASAHAQPTSFHFAQVCDKNTNNAASVSAK